MQKNQQQTKTTTKITTTQSKSVLKFQSLYLSSAVERATPGEEVPGSIPAVAARSLQVGSVSV